MNNRNDILIEVKKYFKIEELVPKDVVNRFGQRSWFFLDTNLLQLILLLRTKILKVPMICNDYIFGGKNQQRGLRANTSDLVKSKSGLYLSAHIFGKATDFVFNPKLDMNAEKARKLIIEKQNEIPFNIRMEENVTWLHVDVFDFDKKIYLFKV